MMARLTVGIFLVLGMVISALGDDHPNHARSEADKSPALEAFKQLAGEWRGKALHGSTPDQDVRVTYKVTSGGSAVVETVFPGTEHEMVTVIHRDGDSLLLTHYCMLDNQPQMRASSKLDGNQVAFKFLRATNLKSDKAEHMHDATFTFVDKDTLKAEWTHFKDGKSAGPVVIDLKREK